MSSTPDPSDKSQLDPVIQTYQPLPQASQDKYPFSVRAILGESWEKTKGAKLPIIGGHLVICLIGVGLFFAAESLSIVLGFGPDASQLLFQLFICIATPPLFTGLSMIGVHRAADIPVSAFDVLNYFPKFPSLLAAYLLMTILTFIGYILLLLPGIYLAIAYMLTYPLIVEKQLGFWRAMETSRKAVTKRWFRFFFLMSILGLLNILGALLLGIGLIWTLPMSFVAVGIVYRNMFGVAPVNLEA